MGGRLAESESERSADERTQRAFASRVPLKRWLLLWSIGTSTRLEFPPTNRREGRFRAPRRVGGRGISFRVRFRLRRAARRSRAVEGFILSFMYESRSLVIVVPSAREAVAEVKVSPFSLPSSEEVSFAPTTREDSRRTSLAENCDVLARIRPFSFSLSLFGIFLSSSPFFSFSLYIQLLIVSCATVVLSRSFKIVTRCIDATYLFIRVK